MIPVLINDFRRLMERKGILLVIVLLTAGAIAAAVFMSTKSETVANIALVSESSLQMEEYDGLNITVLETKPAYSELVSANYDAIVTADSSGGYTVETVKNRETEQAVLDILQYGEIQGDYQANSRGTGSTIFGFLIMFMLMEGSMLMFLFSDDKEQEQLDRVAASPIPVTKYLLAHSVFNFAFLFVPTVGLMYLITSLMGVGIGYSFVQVVLLIGLLSAFGTAFSLMLHSFSSKNDTANMMGSVVIIITSILSGSFFSMDNGNKILEAIVKALPQKAFLSFAESLEQGGFHHSIWYAIALTAGFFLFAVIKTNRDYVRSR